MILSVWEAATEDRLTTASRPGRREVYRADPRYLLGLAPEVAARAAWVRAGEVGPEPPRIRAAGDEPKGPADQVRSDIDGRWAGAHGRLAARLGHLPTPSDLASVMNCSAMHVRRVAARLGLALTMRKAVEQRYRSALPRIWGEAHAGLVRRLGRPPTSAEFAADRRCTVQHVRSTARRLGLALSAAVVTDAGPQPGSIIGRTLAALRDGGPAVATEVARRAGVPRRRVSSCLPELIRKGLVVRLGTAPGWGNGAGMYSATPTGGDA